PAAKRHVPQVLPIRIGVFSYCAAPTSGILCEQIDKEFKYLKLSRKSGDRMDFSLPDGLLQYLSELDAFIETEIKPLEQQDDNIRFFDHRREWARTDFEAGGLPRHDWESLLAEARRRADRAGHLRFTLPR